MKKTMYIALWALLCVWTQASAQFVKLPDGGTNQKSMIGQQVGITDIEIHWNAPGVKGREGKIWGTSVANFGQINLGFGTAKLSPWRAGANECTTMEFSTDVTINGKPLAAGKYGFFIELQADSSTLIFSSNPDQWGSYFYKPEEDVLKVAVKQQKDLPQSREWLAYTFANPTKNTVEVALEWEHWRIPFTVGVDLNKTVLPAVRKQLSGAMGFDPPSLITAAQWCNTNDINLEEALGWINTATNPNLGGIKTFAALSTKSKLESKLGRTADADKTMAIALENASIFEMHGYGRQLVNEKKYKEALAVFEQNYRKNGDTWPTHVGLARGYSAVGDVKKALEHAKIAQGQAPDDVNKKSLEAMVKTLSEGKTIVQ